MARQIAAAQQAEERAKAEATVKRVAAAQARRVATGLMAKGMAEPRPVVEAQTTEGWANRHRNQEELPIDVRSKVGASGHLTEAEVRQVPDLQEIEAKRLAEARAAEESATARAEAEARRAAEAQAADERARAEAERYTAAKRVVEARAAAEAKARAEAEAFAEAKRILEAKAEAERVAAARAAEDRAKAEAEAKRVADLKAKERAEAEAERVVQARAAAEAKAKAEADAYSEAKRILEARAEAERVAAVQAAEERAKTEAEAKRVADLKAKERAEAEAERVVQARAAAEAKAKADAEAYTAAKRILDARAEAEQLAAPRAADERAKPEAETAGQQTRAEAEVRRTAEGSQSCNKVEVVRDSCLLFVGSVAEKAAGEPSTFEDRMKAIVARCEITTSLPLAGGGAEAGKQAVDHVSAGRLKTAKDITDFCSGMAARAVPEFDRLNARGQGATTPVISPTGASPPKLPVRGNLRVRSAQKCVQAVETRYLSKTTNRYDGATLWEVPDVIVQFYVDSNTEHHSRAYYGGRPYVMMAVSINEVETNGMVVKHGDHSEFHCVLDDQGNVLGIERPRS